MDIEGAGEKSVSAIMAGMSLAIQSTEKEVMTAAQTVRRIPHFKTPEKKAHLYVFLFLDFFFLCFFCPLFRFVRRDEKTMSTINCECQ